MDDDEYSKQFKLILVLGIAFFVSGYFAIREIRFAIWGTNAKATITEVREYSEVGRRGSTSPKLAVYYTYTDDDGKTHEGRDEVPTDWSPPDQNVNVEYLPGVEGASRLEGNSSSATIWMFLACCGGVGYLAYRLNRAVNEPARGRKRTR